ncbi:MAG: DUF1990 domain-containing protein [Terracidiphilus sp.]
MRKPTADEIGREVAAIPRRALMSAAYLSVECGLLAGRAPSGFKHDRMKTRLGQGRQAFEAAVRGFEGWKHFDLGWVRVANPSARIEIGQIVAVEVHSLGVWSLNLSHIVEVVGREDCFGFLYKTTANHIEEGEERFVLSIENGSGSVWYEVEAVSKPQNLLAKLGFPVTRAFQHRFARESHRRMLRAVGARE